MLFLPENAKKLNFCLTFMTNVKLSPLKCHIPMVKNKKMSLRILWRDILLYAYWRHSVSFCSISAVISGLSRSTAFNLSRPWAMR